MFLDEKSILETGEVEFFIQSNNLNLKIITLEKHYIIEDQ